MLPSWRRWSAIWCSMVSRATLVLPAPVGAHSSMFSAVFRAVSQTRLWMRFRLGHAREGRAGPTLGGPRSSCSFSPSLKGLGLSAGTCTSSHPCTPAPAIHILLMRSNVSTTLFVKFSFPFHSFSLLSLVKDGTDKTDSSHALEPELPHQRRCINLPADTIMCLSSKLYIPARWLLSPMLHDIKAANKFLDLPNGMGHRGS